MTKPYILFLQVSKENNLGKVYLFWGNTSNSKLEQSGFFFPQSEIEKNSGVLHSALFAL